MASLARRSQPETGASEESARHPTRTLGIGAIGGFLSGLLGVGGGIIMVPLLALKGGLPQRSAHAVSLAAIIPVSTAGLVTYGITADVPLREPLALTVGAVIGARLGTRLLIRLDETRLKLAFGVFLLLASILMVIDP